MLIPKIAMIGFGEAARAFTDGWGRTKAKGVMASDVRQDASIQAAAETFGVTLHPSKAEALVDAECVFSLVTADQALIAAEQSAGFLRPGTIWLDGNSCAPETKRRAAQKIEAAGGLYVDMAIMAPVHPKKHRVPILLSGPHASAAEKILAALDMSGSVTGKTVGHASTIKMVRSIMIKGFEALSAECFLAARAAGVEDEVIASLQASDPGFDWAARGAYNLERMMLHGTRRAAEMREVAQTVADLGLFPEMAEATVTWQDRIAALKLDAGNGDLADRADRILAGLKDVPHDHL